MVWFYAVGFLRFWGCVAAYYSSVVVLLAVFLLDAMFCGVLLCLIALIGICVCGGFAWRCVSGVHVVVLLLADVAGLRGFWAWVCDLVVACYGGCLWCLLFVLFGVSSECCGFGCAVIRCV